MTALRLQLHQAPTAGQPEYFVTIQNEEFVVGCQRFLVAGWNS
jgi:hypothetical protein